MALVIVESETASELALDPGVLFDRSILSGLALGPVTCGVLKLYHLWEVPFEDHHCIQLHVDTIMATGTGEKVLIFCKGAYLVLSSLVKRGSGLAAILYLVFLHKSSFS